MIVLKFQPAVVANSYKYKYKTMADVRPIIKCLTNNQPIFTRRSEPFGKFCSVEKKPENFHHFLFSPPAAFKHKLDIKRSQIFFSSNSLFHLFILHTKVN